MQKSEVQPKSVFVGTKPSLEGAQIIVSPLEVWGAQRGKRSDVELMKVLFEERAGRDRAFARDVVEAGGGSRAQRKWYENVAQRIRGMEKCDTPAEVNAFLEAQGLKSEGRYGRLLKRYFANTGQSYSALEYRKALGIPLPEEIIGGQSVQEKRGVGLRRESAEVLRRKVSGQLPVEEQPAAEVPAESVTAPEVAQKPPLEPGTPAETAGERLRRLTEPAEPTKPTEPRRETAFRRIIEAPDEGKTLAQLAEAGLEVPERAEAPAEVQPPSVSGEALRRRRPSWKEINLQVGQGILGAIAIVKERALSVKRIPGIVRERRGKGPTAGEKFARDTLRVLGVPEERKRDRLYEGLKTIPKTIRLIWTHGTEGMEPEERAKFIRRRVKTYAAVGVVCVGVSVTAIYFSSHPELVKDLAERLGDIPQGVSGLVQHFHERIAAGPTPTAVPPVPTHIPTPTPGIQIPSVPSRYETITQMTQNIQRAVADSYQHLDAALQAAREAAAAAPTPAETLHTNILDLISRGIEIGRGQGAFQAAESLARTLCQSVGINNPSSEVLLTIQDAVKDQIVGSGFQVGQHLAVNPDTLAHALEVTAQGATINIEAGRAMPVNLKPEDVEVLEQIARAIAGS